VNHVARNKFRLPVQQREVASAWRERGYGCSAFSDPPGREWKDFVHASNELVTVVEGRLMITIAGEALIAEPGDEVFIPRGALHSVKNLHDATTRWLYGYD
jgi:quercetin dioxygenase-like cupin family protein